MKKILLIINIYFCFVGIKIIGQEDSIITADTIVTITDIDNNLPPKYEYLDLNFRKEKTLFKLGISYLFAKYDTVFDVASFGSTLVFERKIIPSISVIVENDIDFSFYNSNIAWNSSGNLGLRYYYSMNKRIKESIGANNFHGNYFGIKLTQIYSYRDGYSVFNGGNPIRFKHLRFEPFLNLSWGVQRRIGKWAFFDIGPYFSINRYYNYFGANIHLGLCYGK